MPIISFKVTKQEYDSISYYSRVTSQFEGRQISHTEIIKRALRDKYPVMDQEMLNKDKIIGSGLLYDRL